MILYFKDTFFKKKLPFKATKYNEYLFVLKKFRQKIKYSARKNGIPVVLENSGKQKIWKKYFSCYF